MNVMDCAWLIVHRIIIWDNGDYILELYGETSKNELYDLAKTAKVYKDDK